VFCGLWLILIDVSGAVYFRFVVRFNIVCGALLHSLWRNFMVMGEVVGVADYVLADDERCG